MNRKDYIENMSKEKFDAGLIKFNIPRADDIYATNGEGVWGYVEPAEKELYNDDTYTGTIKAILLNEPLYDCGFYLFDEVTLVCHGDIRPTLDPSIRTVSP